MKINNKGFTMVELLAVIIIMGIMMVLGLSILTNTITKSRKKEYVSAALKMVSRAEYMVRAKSNIIEKPDDKNAIVMNLRYLDDGAFSSAPYGGKYDFDASFVLVKNDDDELKYYVMLVERVPKGGYFGISFTSADTVQNNGIETVNSIESSALLSATDNASVCTYINNKLSDDSIIEVENVYFG